VEEVHQIAVDLLVYILALFQERRWLWQLLLQPCYLGLDALGFGVVSVRQSVYFGQTDPAALFALDCVQVGDSLPQAGVLDEDVQDPQADLLDVVVAAPHVLLGDQTMDLLLFMQFHVERPAQGPDRHQGSPKHTK
jgi:hypothetical protein